MKIKYYWVRAYSQNGTLIGIDYKETSEGAIVTQSYIESVVKDWCDLFEMNFENTMREYSHMTFREITKEEYDEITRISKEPYADIII